jgi:PAS domain S-box-containing protein
MDGEGQKPEEELEALGERTDEYQSILENSTVGIFQSTVDGRFLKVNSAFAGILGYDSPEGLVDSIGDIENQFYHHCERRPEIIAVVETKEGIYKFDAECRRKDGSVIIGSLNIRAIRDK